MGKVTNAFLFWLPSCLLIHLVQRDFLNLCEVSLLLLRFPSGCLATFGCSTFLAHFSLADTVDKLFLAFSVAKEFANF